MKMLALFAAVAISGLAADWSPKLAAQYLDGRQKDWFAWKQAQSADGPCVSCHTGLTYLLARPALRRMLHEKEPTMYETGLMNRLRAKAGQKAPGVLQGVETIFTAMFLAREEQGKAAFEQLWTLQTKDGRLKGAFPWYNANLDPWETPAAFYFGAALGAVAVGHAPAEYRNQPEIQERIKSLADYLGGPLEDQPLHSSVAWLWASSALPEVAAAPRRQFIIDQVFAKQAADGAWTLDSLGPFSAHSDAPPSPTGSNAYATGLVTFVLGQAGVPPSDKRLARARDWLKTHQDRATGAWPGVSMNKRFPADSMESKFMQDAATAYAVLALAGGGQ